IRDLIVTGVQTCALPISTILARTSPRFARGLVPRARLSLPASSSRFLRRRSFCSIFSGACFSVTESKSTTLGELPHLNGAWHHRSEERRVGKECRARWWL